MKIVYFYLYELTVSDINKVIKTEKKVLTEKYSLKWKQSELYGKVTIKLDLDVA